MAIRTEGTEAHCVSLHLRMKSATWLGRRLFSAGGICNSAPDPSAQNISQIELSKYKGALNEILSFSPRLKCLITQENSSTSGSCRITTPLGSPVEPDVKMIKAESLGTNSICGGSASA